MRSIYMLLFLLLSSIGALAQSSHDQRLLESYEGEYLDRLEKQSPVIYQRLNFYLDNTYQIIEKHPKKFTGPIETIKIKDLDNINIFEVQNSNKISPDYKRKLVFKIKGTNKLLILESMEQFNKDFNKNRQSK
jgi:hypothetical protein